MGKAILFIDGDNVNNTDYVDSVISEAYKFGELSEKHIYANFKSVSDAWSQAIYKYAITAHHCPVITKRKNSTDIALAIDVVQHTYENEDVDTYIIATNDKDFMQLALYLRRIGKKSVCLYVDADCKACLAFDEAHILSPSKAAATTKKTAGATKEEAVKAAAQATKAKQSKKAPKPEETEETQANCYEIVSSLSDTIKAKTGAGKLYFVSDLREERREEIKYYMKITKQTFIINAVRKMLKTYPELLTGVKLKSLTENGKQNYYLERE